MKFFKKKLFSLFSIFIAFFNFIAGYFGLNSNIKEPIQKPQVSPQEESLVSYVPNAKYLTTPDKNSISVVVNNLHISNLNGTAVTTGSTAIVIMYTENT